MSVRSVRGLEMMVRSMTDEEKLSEERNVGEPFIITCPKALQAREMLSP